MGLKLPRKLLEPNATWFDVKTGQPTSVFFDYMRQADFALRALIAQGTPVIAAALDTPSAINEGDLAFVSNGRKHGEGGGSGTGVLVFSDGTNWCAVDTGLPVAV